jgi:endonuclease/exonuclease/phosphatase (EEP) superfamily protein YafD
MGVLIRLVAWTSFVLATILTGLRFLQLEQPAAQKAVAFMALTIPLFGVALLLFVSHVFFPGKSRWQITMAVAGLSLAGLALQGWWMSPLFIGDKPTPGPQAEPFRVLTLNLDTGSADPNDVVSTAVTSGADILILQEVVPNTLTRMESAGLDSVFPHRAGQPFVNGRYGTMVFSNVALSDVTYLGTHSTTVQVKATLPRQQIWLLAVGVPAPGSGTPEPWLADLQQLATTVRELHPAIVAGDFEATFDHQPFADLLDLGLRDVGERTNAGWQPTWPTDRARFGISFPRIGRVDHVLVGSLLAPLSQDTVTVPGADHRGVLAEVAFR